jgi:ATP-dependent HslUV protease subunit HslV
MSEFHGTTVLAVKHKGKVVVASDGQVTMGEIAFKQGLKKCADSTTER